MLIIYESQLLSREKKEPSVCEKEKRKKEMINRME